MGHNFRLKNVRTEYGRSSTNVTKEKAILLIIYLHLSICISIHIFYVYLCLIISYTLKNASINMIDYLVSRKESFYFLIMFLRPVDQYVTHMTLGFSVYFSLDSGSGDKDFDWSLVEVICQHNQPYLCSSLFFPPPSVSLYIIIR